MVEQISVQDMYKLLVFIQQYKLKIKGVIVRVEDGEVYYFLDSDTFKKTVKFCSFDDILGFLEMMVRDGRISELQ